MLETIDIFDNFAFGLAKSKTITTYYHHNDLNTADKIVDTLMKESMQADVTLVKEIAEKDNKLVKQLSKEIDKEANLLIDKEKNIDTKIINYYKQNVDLYRQLIKENEANQKRLKKYFNRKKEGNEMNGANIRIVELANSSCSVFRYFR